MNTQKKQLVPIGWYPSYREEYTSPKYSIVMRDSEHFLVWQLLKAMTIYEGEEIGLVKTGRNFLSSYTGIKESKIRTILERFVEHNILVKITATKEIGTVYKLINPDSKKGYYRFYRKYLYVDALNKVGISKDHIMIWGYLHSIAVYSKETAAELGSGKVTYQLISASCHIEEAKVRKIIYYFDRIGLIERQSEKSGKYVTLTFKIVPWSTDQFQESKVHQSSDYSSTYTDQAIVDISESTARHDNSPDGFFRYLENYRFS